ncbi:protocadherin-1-like [Amphiura filiformis]|uniref:protocadherin-1-like n=1 Tax=Amphiura filiformis TaxID=82378 RepID=UPI003B21E971
MYDLLLLAIDGGVTPLTGSARLNVTVLDSDDHRPQFVRKEYTVSIAENLDVGTEILKVEAHDPDLGTNGQIIYDFSRSVALFDIESDTGAIRTKGRVDYETDTSFQLIVKCSNNVPNPVSDFASVTINIIDVNDNRPTLEVNAIEGSGNYIHIPETSPPSTPLAFVKVSDPDSGSSGEVRLLLSGHYDHFELQMVSATRYFLATKTELDREDVAVYNITIIAEDKGDPIQWRQRKFAIFLDDVNDNAPFFSKPIYYTQIVENNAPDTRIETIIATDLDEGENATVVYSLPGNQHGFAIDSESGELIATSVLDREVASTIAVTVSACDQGRPQPMCNNVSVMLTVLDENDNPPEFVLGTYEFGVYENQLEGTLVGQVQAIDKDMGDNSRVTYAIKTEGAREYFRIDGSSGEIFTKISSLDREVQASYAMVVTATDGGGVRAERTTGVTVLITVLDRNDNAPRIVYPNPQDDAVFIPLHAQPGFVVCQMEAEDYDDGVNARLSYGILDGNIYDIFGMRKGGQLVTSRSLRPQWAGVHFLNLRVKDSGASSIETTAQLTVVIADMSFNESIREDMFFQLYNMTVNTFLKMEADTGQAQGAASKWPVIAVIALGSVAFILLMIFLIVATKCRDKNKNRENQYAAPPANTTDDMNTGSKPPSERKTSGTNSTNISLATSQSSIPSKNIQKWKNAEKNGSIDSRLGNKQMTTFGSNSDVHSDSMQSLHSNSNRRTPDPDAEVQKLLNKLRHQEGGDAADDFSHSSCDSGHGDSDRDTRESNGTNSMSPDINELQNGRAQSYPRLAPLAQISGRSLMNAGGERGSYAASSLCTPECRTLGHSDLCWSQNTINGRPKADSFSGASSSQSRTLPSAGRSAARHQDHAGDPRLRSSGVGRESPSRQSSNSRESPNQLSVPSARMGAHTAVASPNHNQNSGQRSGQSTDRNASSPSKTDAGAGRGGGANTPGAGPLTPISEHPEDNPFDHRGRTHRGDKSSRGRGGKPRAQTDHGRINNNYQPDDRQQRTPTNVTFKDDRTSTNPNGSYSTNRSSHRHAPSPLSNNIRNNVQHGMIVEASGYGSHSSVSSESSSEVNSHGGYSLDDLDGVLERCDIPGMDATITMDKSDQVPFTDWV